jgi:hypothetical protein
VTTTLDDHQISPAAHTVRGRIMNRLVGLGFAAAAVGNAIATMRQQVAHAVSLDRSSTPSGCAVARSPISA